jgi:hypothetical protein
MVSTVRVVTKKQAMAILGCSKRTLERRMAAGEWTLSIVHGPHGPERRIHLPAPPPGDGGTPPGDGSPATTVAIREIVTPATSPANPSPTADRDLARLALAVAADIQAENARLRAVIESLRRPWWRRIGDRLRRRP